MSKLLEALNNGYAGYIQWKPIEEWESKRGILGIYASNDTPIARENVNVFLMVGDRINSLRMYPRAALKAARIDCADIAVFAGIEVKRT